ncbi:MAG: hypothetical protein ACP5EN_00900 [Rhodovulum sp.]
MATDSSFEERLRRIGAGRAEAAGATPAAIPDEKGTNRLLVIGLAVVLVFGAGITAATAVFRAQSVESSGLLADDGWEPLVSKGLAVGDGSGERVDGNWQRIADKD